MKTIAEIERTSESQENTARPLKKKRVLISGFPAREIKPDGFLYAKVRCERKTTGIRAIVGIENLTSILPGNPPEGGGRVRPGEMDFMEVLACSL